MPKQSYGPDTEKRVKRLFEALLDHAVDVWKGEDNLGVESYTYEDKKLLRFETTLRALVRLIEKKCNLSLTKDEVRQAITHYLQKHLTILKDGRGKKRGSEEWVFFLELWSEYSEKEKNLAKFSEEWNNKRTEGSKKAVSKLDEKEELPEEKEESPLPENGKSRCPYQGLEAFTEEEREFFFGRDEVVEEIKSKLENGCNFVPLIGASGSGKSSVVRAGLIPSLKDSGWKILDPINPGFSPLVTLQTRLQEFFTNNVDAQKLVAQCIEKKDLKPILESFPHKQKVLLVVDQFEELFTIAEEKEVDPFIKLITQVVNFPNYSLAVVTTMRVDFIDRCLKYESLQQIILIQNNAKYLPPLEGLPLRDAIKKPAEVQKYKVAEDLIFKILEDIQKEPGFLPLLEFALTQLWRKRDKEKRELTLEAYESIQGIQGALNLYADKVYEFKDYPEEKPTKPRPEREKDLIKRIFLNLVRTSDEEKDTRWRRNKNHILSLATNKKDGEKVLEALVKARLLVTGSSKSKETRSSETEENVWVDLAHEALIEKWDKLIEWRKESRDIRRIAELLEQRWQQYRQNKQSKQKEQDYDYLLEGVLLQLAHRNQDKLKEILRTELWEFCQKSFSVYSFYGTKIDYRDLAKLLKDKKWQEADDKTAELILMAAKCKYLDEKAMEILPPEDLQKINQLWIKYSEKKFGFSVQKEIYEDLGATSEYNEELWTKFCDRVGWKKDEDWLYHDEFTFDLNDAHKGHLPAAVRRYWKQGWWSHDFYDCLFSSLDLPMVELTNSPQDKALLRHFYRELYAYEFPDPNERESLENMEQYLDLKAQGWYGENNYHIIIFFQDGKPIAGVIADFLAKANTGVVEFLVVAPEFRKGKIGKALLKYTENLLVEDAKKLGRELDCIVGEMNDPFQTTQAKDNLDPARRALIWHKWGYGGLDFPYVQPALSESQQPVGNLLLIAKIFREAWSRAIPSKTVRDIVQEYLRLAMGRDNPNDCAEYREMTAFLDGRREVPVLSLARYLGQYPSMEISDVKKPDEADFAAVMSVYQSSFPVSPLTIGPQEFAEALASVEKYEQSFGFHYHLWAIRITPTAPVEGMASFFSFPEAGFCGYVAFQGSLSGTWRMRPLLARMEQQMLQERELDDVGGWYIETDLKRSLFLRLGFWEVDVKYEQPPLSEQQVSLPIRLFYKPFGRVYGKPKVKCSDFLKAIARIFQVVYRIETPTEHPCYLELKKQVEDSEVINLKSKI